MRNESVLKQTLFAVMGLTVETLLEASECWLHLMEFQKIIFSSLLLYPLPIFLLSSSIISCNYSFLTPLNSASHLLPSPPLFSPILVFLPLLFSPSISSSFPSPLLSIISISFHSLFFPHSFPFSFLSLVSDFPSPSVPVVFQELSRLASNLGSFYPLSLSTEITAPQPPCLSLHFVSDISFTSFLAMMAYHQTPLMSISV